MGFALNRMRRRDGSRVRPEPLIVAVVLAGGLIATPTPASSNSAPGAEKCHGHRATIVGTQGPDDLHGTNHRDVVALRGGADTFVGHRGRDLVCGGGDDDLIRGGADSDRVRGGTGDDRLGGKNLFKPKE
jgi:Ca2+-binding RTX toxin-like protein